MCAGVYRIQCSRDKILKIVYYKRNNWVEKEKMYPMNDQNDAQNCCQMETSDSASDNNKNDDSNLNLSNIKVTVGIDEDLQMILEMDPSIVDLGVDVIGCTPDKISPSHTPKAYGLPPILGG